MLRGFLTAPMAYLFYLSLFSSFKPCRDASFAPVSFDACVEWGRWPRSTRTGCSSKCESKWPRFLTRHERLDKGRNYCVRGPQTVHRPFGYEVHLYHQPDLSRQRTSCDGSCTLFFYIALDFIFCTFAVSGINHFTRHDICFYRRDENARFIKSEKEGRFISSWCGSDSAAGR